MTTDNRELRKALGSFATGVCIVTIAPELNTPIGMTINSFASVSLDPPLISWSIQNNSECFDSFNAADTFAINILSADQQELAQSYARKGQHQLQEAHFYRGQSGAPLLHGALAAFECRLWARYPGGDHHIVVGEVLAFVARPMSRALGFYKGTYTEIL